MKLDADWLRSEAARRVIGMLEEAGHQAWFVGGCVRNPLLGEPVSDLDISTDARPETVTTLAKSAGLKAIPTGIDHGTITVVSDGQPFEVTTFRRDVETDGRRAVVAFAETLEEDAQRRDFTMNALYADGRGKVVDPVGGLPDLEARRFRFIGNAEDRVREDALRILRFFRFHAWYGAPDGGIDPDGLAACATLVDLLDTLSRERIGQEMRKLLAAPDPAPALASFAITGGLARILPGAEAAMIAPLVHVETAAGLASDWLRRLAMLGGRDEAVHLRLSKAEARGLAVLKSALASDARPAELGYRLGHDTALSVLAIRAAGLGAEISYFDTNAAQEGSEKHFPLRAADLADRFSGPALGAALKQAELRWIDSNFELTKADLLG